MLKDHSDFFEILSIFLSHLFILLADYLKNEADFRNLRDRKFLFFTKIQRTNCMRDSNERDRLSIRRFYKGMLGT